MPLNVTVSACNSDLYEEPSYLCNANYTVSPATTFCNSSPSYITNHDIILDEDPAQQRNTESLGECLLDSHKCTTFFDELDDLGVDESDNYLDAASMNTN